MNRPGPNDTFRLFVYGTLKMGGLRHAPLAHRPHLGEVRTEPGYALYDLGGFPGLVPDHEGSSMVWGDVYEVDGSLLPTLDAMEAAPSLFELAPVRVEGHGGVTWAYYYRQAVAGCSRIASGRWDNPPEG